MSIEVLRNEIMQIHGLMRKHVLGAGIKEAWYDRFLRNIEMWPEERLHLVHTQLKSIYETEWQEVEAVWTKPHINEEMWENYEWLFDGKDVLEEQKMLTVARRLLVKALRNFRKEYTELLNGAKKNTQEREAGGQTEGGVETVSES